MAVLTVDDFERLPGDLAQQYDLIDGKLVEAPGRTARAHQVRDRLIVLLFPIVEERDLGRVIGEQEYDFSGDVYGPAVSFAGPAKLPLLDNDKRVQRFVPDLAIEIASDSDTFSGLLRKKDRYLAAGVTEVWLISAEAQDILIFTKDRVHWLHASGVLATDLLPGITVSVEDLFRGL